MKVARYTIYAKTGCISELIEAIKSYPQYGLPKLPHRWRIYWGASLGPWDVVIWEAEFESYREYAAWNEEFWTAPRVGEWNDLRRDLVERGGGGEVWNVEQFG